MKTMYAQKNPYPMRYLSCTRWHSESKRQST